MRKPLIAFAVTLTVFAIGKPGKTDNSTCQTLAVTASDGYVNIRSEPMVKTGNIVGVLPSGSEIETERQSRGWYEIESPFTGWLAGNQIAKVKCDRARDISTTVGHPAITELGERAS